MEIGLISTWEWECVFQNYLPLTSYSSNASRIAKHWWILQYAIIYSHQECIQINFIEEKSYRELDKIALECFAEVLPDVTPLRNTEANENRGLSEFQAEVVQLAAVLNGDHYLSSFPDETGKKMSVKEAHDYVKGAVSRFIRASKQALQLGADESAIVDMRSSLTTRSSSVPH